MRNPGTSEDQNGTWTTVWNAAGIDDSFAVTASFYTVLVCIALLVLLLWSEYRAVTKERDDA